jgi:hypothetical protein
VVTDPVLKDPGQIYAADGNGDAAGKGGAAE